MIGPLARPDMKLPPAVPASEASKEAAAAVTAPPTPPTPSPPPEPDLGKYTVERCARITVAIACRPGDMSKIFEEHELSARDWEHVKNHWLEAIRQEMGRGKNALLRRYDTAYLEQVEAERGPIGIEEYAKLAVAAERGRVGAEVAEMRLPAGAPMRIERVWTERAAGDEALGERVRAAVEQRRES